MPDTPDSGASANGAGGNGRGGERRRRSDQCTRIAAVGDFHLGVEDVGVYREQFARVNEEADVLVLCGDLTHRGLPNELKVVVGELSDVKVPIVAVLGNHDHESGNVAEAEAILRGRGIHLLDGSSYQLNDQVGFAGVKGFIGGFGRGMLTAFGEAETKSIVNVALDEVHKLEMALRRLPTPVRIAVLHYAPVAATVAGEPEVIFPFLGTDRLAEPLDRFQAAAAFHGHAHAGAFRGETPGGVPVFNVSLPVLRREGLGPLYYVHEVPIPAAHPATVQSTP